jgi:hypothetical protein
MDALDAYKAMLTNVSAMESDSSTSSFRSYVEYAVFIEVTSESNPKWRTSSGTEDFNKSFKDAYAEAVKIANSKIQPKDPLVVVRAVERTVATVTHLDGTVEEEPIELRWLTPIEIGKLLKS